MRGKNFDSLILKKILRKVAGNTTETISAHLQPILSNLSNPHFLYEEPIFLILKSLCFFAGRQNRPAATATTERATAAAITKEHL